MTNGSGRLFHNLVVENMKEFTKLSMLAEGMEYLHGCPRVVVESGDKVIEVSTSLFSIL